MSSEVVAVEVAISEEESLRRLAGRGRVDDDPKTVKKRIEVQGSKAIAPIREYYRSLGILRSVDGMGSVPEVFELIQKELL